MSLSIVLISTQLVAGIDLFSAVSLHVYFIYVPFEKQVNQKGDITNCK